MSDKHDDYQRLPGDSIAIPKSQFEATDMKVDMERRRRFVKAGGPQLSRRPHIEQMLGGAMAVAQHQLNGYLTKIAQGEELNPAEARIFFQLVDAIKKLTGEEREQRKFEGLSDMPEDEFKNLREHAAKVLAGDTVDGEVEEDGE